MFSILKSIVLPAVVIAAGFASIVALSAPLESAKPQLPETFSDTDLSLNGSRLKGFALGMEGLLADWYWVRSLHYIGDKMVNRRVSNIDIENLNSLNPRLLHPLLENATDLDPQFIGAYTYGAIVLPAIDKQKAVQLAQKGIANNPNEWRLHQHLGFIYWKLGEFDKAADAYGSGAGIPGASPFLRLMAAAMTTEGGSRTTARSIYRQMLAESDDDAVKVTARRRLMQLEWLDQRDAIDAELMKLQTTGSGVCPASLNEIFTALQRIQLPEGEFRVDSAKRLVDPSMAPYLLDREKCVVKLDVENTQVALN